MKNAFDFLAEHLGLKYDKNINLVHGSVNGINVVMGAPAGFMLPQRIVSLTVARDGQCITADDKAKLQNLHKSIERVVCAGKNISIFTKDIALGRPKTVKGQSKLEAAFIQQVTALVSEMGYINTCDKCDSTEGVCLCLIGDEISHMCQQHYQEAERAYNDAKGEVTESEGILPAGLLGAFLGCLVGVILIAILGAIGFIASIGGIVLAICAIKGYELLGKKMSKLGLVLTIIMMIGMVYFAQMLSYCIYLSIEFDVSFAQIFLSLHELIFTDTQIIISYYGELGLLYLFTLLGAIQPIIVANKKMSFRAGCRQLFITHGTSNDTDPNNQQF